VSGKRGLTQADITDASIALVDSEGASALTLSRVAKELDVKPPSLYNHVDGLDTLRRNVGMRVAEAFGHQLGRAAMGRSGRDAVVAIAAEFRAYAREHPDLYGLSTQARPDDVEYTQVATLAIEPVLAVLRAYELDDNELIHAARMFRSALHGFVSLEITGGFGIDVDVDASFDWLVGRVADSLDS